jgi:hypothetical protein
MTDPLTAAAALAAAAVYVAKTSYEFVLKSKNGNGNGNGDRYGKRDLCRAIEAQAMLQVSLDAQTRILEEIKNMQQDTRDGVRELITIAKTRSTPR